jgi:hypothetical protein
MDSGFDMDIAQDMDIDAWAGLTVESLQSAVRPFF